MVKHNTHFLSAFSVLSVVNGLFSVEPTLISWL